MNNARRKEIARAVALLNEAQTIIATCAEEEQEAYDNMPESLQESERGQQSYVAADTMASTADNIQSCVDDLENMEGL